MRRSITPLTIVENHPRMLAVLAASLASCVALLWAFVVLGSSMASAASPTYTIKDLGTLGGTYSSAEGINDTGQVVGVSEISTAARHAFLYTGGQMQDLNQGTTSSESTAHDINGSGEVVGGQTSRGIMPTCTREARCETWVRLVATATAKPGA